MLGLKPFSIVLKVKGDWGIGHLLRVLVMVDWRLKNVSRSKEEESLRKES